MSNHSGKYWLIIIVALLTCLLSSGILLVIKLASQRPTEISINSTTPPNYSFEIYIDGAVANPGIYPAEKGDTIANLMQAAGLVPDADTSQLKLYIPSINESRLQPRGQKISLNQADAWLLEALPGIGQGKAQAIVDYRSKYGPFHRIEDLLKVTGISKSTIDNIKNLVSVER